MYKRAQYHILSNRLKESRRFLQVLNGPRQVGKTTLIKQVSTTLKAPYHFASADETREADAVWIAQQWETARLKMKAGGHNEMILFIDEVQKVPDWSREVKKQWDKDTWDEVNLKTVLLGSASLLIQEGLTESLAGRFELIPMPHWSLTEMEKAFGFGPEQYVWFGGYPGGATLVEEEQRWREYIRNSLVETTISKDILMLTRVHKPALLRRLFELACAKSGQIISYNKMLGQLQDAGNTTTLSHYLDLLDMAGLVAGLENYSPSKIRTRASSPKFQVMNTALQSVFSPFNFSQIRQQPAEWGRHVESAIGAHLANAAKTSNMALCYWRHRDDEVDFILEKDGQAIAIEVKSGVRRKARGIDVFAQKYKPHKTLLVGSEGLPWQQFLEMNPVELF
ncbi:MAG: ATP-binding protein [Lewinellaceae bacterium]|nr:ATP-binding protein [Lewinellaceae bacterium]